MHHFGIIREMGGGGGRGRGGPNVSLTLSKIYLASRGLFDLPRSSSRLI